MLLKVSSSVYFKKKGILEVYGIRYDIYSFKSIDIAKIIHLVWKKKLTSIEVLLGKTEPGHNLQSKEILITCRVKKFAHLKKNDMGGAREIEIDL